MWQQQQKRNKAVVRHELEVATAHRVRAIEGLDFDAYEHLTQQIDDLLAEMAAFPSVQRIT